MKYKQGDILENKSGKVKVLGVCGEVYFISNEGNFAVVQSPAYTVKELDDREYKKVELEPLWQHIPPEEFIRMAEKMERCWVWDSREGDALLRVSQGFKYGDHFCYMASNVFFKHASKTHPITGEVAK